MLWKTAALALMLAAAGLVATTGQPGETRTVVSGGGYFPVLIRLKTGELLAVLRGGAPHIGRQGRLDTVVSRDNGKTWSAPATVVDGPDDDRNPAFGQLSDGTILLAYVIRRGYDESGLKLRTTEADGVYLLSSRDRGKTWTKPERSETIHNFYSGRDTVSPYGKIVQLPDGTVLMAVYFQFRDARGHQSYVFRSKDGGKTWGEQTLIGEHFDETALLLLRGGRLLAAMRSEKGGHLATAFSSDQGLTWTSPLPITADNEHPADLIRLKNGDILLAHGERNRPYGVRAMLSHDDGKTWDTGAKITLAAATANTDCGYPSSVQLPDGRIVTMYYQVDDAMSTPASAKTKAIIWRVR